jgi:anthranilate phosphoribosyltransferase
MNTIQTAIEKIAQRENLTGDEMKAVMWEILSGSVTHAQLGGFLVGMRTKGETLEEMTAAAEILRELVVPVKVAEKNLVDIVGTGGDYAQTFNISTTSAFVVAAAGGYVAKHCNRSVSSRCGGADVLEAAGVVLMLTPTQISECIEKVGIGFMLAPQHHVATKHVMVPRKELGIRTFFNLIGPLTNPANARRQLVGVFAKEWVMPIAQVLQRLGSEHALVVHSEDGLDEISIHAPTLLAELKAGKIRQYQIKPEQFGFMPSSLASLKVKNIEESLAMLQQVLQNVPGPAHDIVALNAGAAIYVAGLAEDLAAGISKAQAVIANGAAYAKFNALIELTQKLAAKN